METQANNGHRVSEFVKAKETFKNIIEAFLMFARYYTDHLAKNLKTLNEADIVDTKAVDRLISQVWKIRKEVSASRIRIGFAGRRAIGRQVVNGVLRKNLLPLNNGNNGLSKYFVQISVTNREDVGIPVYNEDSGIEMYFNDASDVRSYLMKMPSQDRFIVKIYIPSKECPSLRDTVLISVPDLDSCCEDETFPPCAVYDAFVIGWDGPEEANRFEDLVSRCLRELLTPPTAFFVFEKGEQNFENAIKNCLSKEFIETPSSQYTFAIGSLAQHTDNAISKTTESQGNDPDQGNQTQAEHSEKGSSNQEATESKQLSDKDDKGKGTSGHPQATSTTDETKQAAPSSGSTDVQQTDRVSKTTEDQGKQTEMDAQDSVQRSDSEQGRAEHSEKGSGDQQATESKPLSDKNDKGKGTSGHPQATSTTDETKEVDPSSGSTDVQQTDHVSKTTEGQGKQTEMGAQDSEQRSNSEQGRAKHSEKGSGEQQATDSKQPSDKDDEDKETSGQPRVSSTTDETKQEDPSSGSTDVQQTDSVSNTTEGQGSEPDQGNVAETGDLDSATHSGQPQADSDEQQATHSDILDEDDSHNATSEQTTGEDLKDDASSASAETREDNLFPDCDEFRLFRNELMKSASSSAIERNFSHLIPLMEEKIEEFLKVVNQATEKTQPEKRSDRAARLKKIKPEEIDGKVKEKFLDDLKQKARHVFEESIKHFCKTILERCIRGKNEMEKDLYQDMVEHLQEGLKLESVDKLYTDSLDFMCDFIRKEVDGSCFCPQNETCIRSEEGEISHHICEKLNNVLKDFKDSRPRLETKLSIESLLEDKETFQSTFNFDETQRYWCFDKKVLKFFPTSFEPKSTKEVEGQLTIWKSVGAEVSVEKAMLHTALRVSTYPLLPSKWVMKQIWFLNHAVPKLVALEEKFIEQVSEIFKNCWSESSRHLMERAIQDLKIDDIVKHTTSWKLGNKLKKMEASLKKMKDMLQKFREQHFQKRTD